MKKTNRGSLLFWILALIAGLVSADLIAQVRPPTDAALGRLIEELTDRRSDDLVDE